MKLLSADDKIDMRQILEQRFAARLSHASQKAENDFGTLFCQLPKHSHFAKRFLVGHVAHAASIEQHNVGFHFASHALVTTRDERVRDLFRVPLVHLTPVSLDK